jgi:hypothetical protein
LRDTTTSGYAAMTTVRPRRGPECRPLIRLCLAARNLTGQPAPTPKIRRSTVHGKGAVGGSVTMPCTGPARSSKRDPQRKDARYVVCTYVPMYSAAGTSPPWPTSVRKHPPSYLVQVARTSNKKIRQTRDQADQTSPSIGRVPGSAFFVPCRPIESGAEPAEPTIDAPTLYLLRTVHSGRCGPERSAASALQTERERDDEEGEDVNSE